jgi:hypothetical protein
MLNVDDESAQRRRNEHQVAVKLLSSDGSRSFVVKITRAVVGRGDGRIGEGDEFGQ